MVKRIAEYLLELLVLVGTTLCVVFLMQCESGRFYFSLYQQTSFLMTGRIFFLTQQRVILSTMLYTLGIACIILCLISYESQEFLRCSRLFFLASAFVISIWDYEFIFYIGKAKALLWSRIADVSLVLFVACLYRVLIGECRLVRRKPVFEKIGFLAGTAAAAAALILDQGKMLWVLKIYFVYSVLYSAAFLWNVFLEQRLKNNFFSVLKRTENLAFLVGSVFSGMILFLVSFYKFDTLTKEYFFYRNFLQYFIVAAVVAFFLVFIRLHRMGIIFGGKANLKLREIERHRHNVTNSLVSYFFAPVNNLIYYIGQLRGAKSAGDWNAQDKVSVSMEKELYRIKRHLANMNVSQNLQGEDLSPNMIKINLACVVDCAVAYACSEFHLNRDLFVCEGEMADGDSYICGEPYALIQAFQAILLAFFDFGVKGSVIRIGLISEGGNAVLTVGAGIAPKCFSLAKRAKKILETKDKMPKLVYDEDLMLYNSQYYLNCHEEKHSLMLRHGIRDTALFRSEFKLWKAKSPGEETEENKIVGTDKREKIILLSTSPEQIDMMQQYLKTEPYSIYVFNTEEDAFSFLKRTENIGLLIIGNLFFGYSVDGICKKIRDVYPMDQLPIIVICRESYKRMAFGILNYVNDVLQEPFEQKELIRKIYCLMLLRKSAKETLKAKVDFLQSQIDPHFIFNALSSIMPLCIQDPPKAYQALNDFSDYLRGRLYPKELQSPIPVYEEMDIIDAYLSIEKIRFPGRIVYEVKGDYDENDVILPLLIEPIVENCIQHGMRPCPEQILHICIGILEKDGYLCFFVRDDGNGMDEEQLRKLRSNDYVSTSSIGFSNVKKRLMLYYNEQLDVDSKKDEGTEISFKIPVLKL